jgi:hypothetical protein
MKRITETRTWHRSDGSVVIWKRLERPGRFKEELGVIRKLLNDAADAFEAAQRVLYRLRGIAIGQA